MTVVGADALYLKPFTTSIIMLGPGQTPDVLVKADQTPGSYHIAARAYASAQNAPFDNTTTTTILQYTKENKIIVTCLGMSSSLQRYLQRHHLHYQPQKSLQTSVGGNIFFTVGLGLNPCPRGRKCQGPNGTRFTASMNNVSFILPSTFSLFQAHDQGVNGMSTTDFPGAPPLKFNYTGNVSRSLWTPTTGSKFYKLKYGARVQIVLQVTSIFTTENQPIHLHGNNFNIIAEGFGNFNANKDTSKFNLVDPPMRNTVAVPVGRWSVIHFVADNPGIWLMHCHLDVHITWGLAMAFLVENGVGELQSLKAPPADLPKC